MKFSRSNFKMQRFESRSPRLESWRTSIPECGGLNPAAPASKSVSNASHIPCAKFGHGTQCVTWVLFLVYQTADFEPETISLPCDVGGAA